MKNIWHENTTDHNVAVHAEKQVIDRILIQTLDATNATRWVM